MARTKQTARKSTGGKAPRAQLASGTTSTFRQYLTTQQNSGQVDIHGKQKKSIFINCENTFREFYFKRPKLATNIFEPLVSLGRVKGIPNQSDLFMRLDIASCMDGPGIFNQGRPSIDLCFVLDVSGSMGSPFPSDSDRRSKLDVAKSCLLAILPKLTESDRISIIQFDDRQDLLFPLQHVTAPNILIIEDILSKLRSRGGTNLGAGIASGFRHLSESENITPPAELITDIRQYRTKRVIFMTDMESTPDDETIVIKLSQDAVGGVVSTPNPPIRSLFAPSIHAPPPAPAPPANGGTAASIQSTTTISANSIFTSIIGIGVDLSVRTVERICAIPGARYISAINASEFMSTVAEEFPYDISPLAFNIRVQFPQELTVNKIYGASELNSVNYGSSSFKISSEFANPLEPCPNSGVESTTTTTNSNIQYQMKGGILLIRLNEIDFPNLNPTQSKKVNFEALDSSADLTTTPRRSSRKKSSPNSATVVDSSPTTVPLPAPASAPALDLPSANFIRVQWTDIQNIEHSCLLECHAPPPLSTNEDISPGCDEGLAKAVCLVRYVDCMERYAASGDKPPITPCSPDEEEDLKTFLQTPLRDLLSMPSFESLPIPLSVIPNRLLRSHETIVQFQQLKTDLLTAFNTFSDETIYTTNQNILQTIQQVIELETKEFQDDITRLQAQLGLHKHTNIIGHENCPYSYLCPISLTIMKDPVIACDGHSYERESIVQWLETHNTSPVTNLPLSNKMVIDNHTLKGAIEEYLSTVSKRSKEETSSPTNMKRTPPSSSSSSPSSASPARGRGTRGGAGKGTPTSETLSGRKRGR